MIDDPTTTETRSPGVRPSDHLERRDGATRDPEALRALAEATARHRQDQDQTALQGTACPRGYAYDLHERSEALRRRARPIHDRADEINRPLPLVEDVNDSQEIKDQRAMSARLRVEAVALEVEADRLVPTQYQRDLQKVGQP